MTLCYLSGALCYIWYYYNFSTFKALYSPIFETVHLLMSTITSSQVSLLVTASYIFVDVSRLCLQLSPFSTLYRDSSTTLLVSVLLTILPRLGSLVVLLNEHPSHFCSCLFGIAIRRVQSFTHFTRLKWNSQKKKKNFSFLAELILLRYLFILSPSLSHLVKPSSAQLLNLGT